MSNEKTSKEMNRRSFLRSTAAAGAGLAFSPMVLGQAGGKKPGDINIGLLGCGAQGQELMNACLKIPGIRFKAVCDIWTAWNQKRVSRILKAYKHVNNTYVDYKEMLDKEKDLDAVIVATPDFWHSEHTVACLEAGLHVYCEKEMSNTLEGARKMLEASKKTGKLLQIGHQRRSNPRYIHCYEKLIDGAKLLGKITCINGQWNRSKAACEDLGFPKNAVIDEATLKKYGFDSMQQFRNWRWYKGLGGGPIVDLGSHQIDIFSWFLGTNPKAVMASGGIDYWKGHDWYDNVMVIYEYQLGDRTVRAFYQTITTNSANGYFETFMGDEGTLVISEASGRGTIYREAWVPAQNWEKWVKMDYIKEPPEEEKEEAPASEGVLDVRETPKPPSYDIPVTMDNKPYHQPHLENFFDAVRGKAKLNCPAEIGYETAVTVLKVNEAVAAGRKLEFKPGEFEV
ncbi:MAG TPA: Gfo/Idh/MocA family oxidoreductase [Sedimentisphaerales bacterium]|nr:Gfo/Idh/MocA family oxidoreductase [Sedimentisphaerales bacterium]